MEILLVSIFVIGYIAIATEHSIHINKAASALITGVLCWGVYIVLSTDFHVVEEHLMHHMGGIAGILFFLLGAMIVVEVIDAHEGFEVVTHQISAKNKVTLLWLVGIVTFFLSSVLDNLATTIVMISIVRKLIDEREARLYFASVIVIAANAGGAWSPIGDVTTTMLWAKGKVSSLNIMIQLILPSLVCLFVPLIYMTFFGGKALQGNVSKTMEQVVEEDHDRVTPTQKSTVFFVGLAALVSVPIIKATTHLPPFMGICLNLGIVWVLTELLHKYRNEARKNALGVIGAIRRTDVPSVLFFLGILLAVASLESTHILSNMATYLDEITNKNHAIIGLGLGLLSAVVDNVPLVAASMGMYDFEMDHFFWEFVAYCAGTGGSCLIIGSAAGVAAMALEKIDFFWYMRNISFAALLGYLAGAFLYIAIAPLLH